MGKLRPEYLGHAELFPTSPTNAADMDLVVQVLCRDSVLSRKSSYAKQLFEERQGASSAASRSVRRSFFLPACLLEELRRTSPSADCGWLVTWWLPLPNWALKGTFLLSTLSRTWILTFMKTGRVWPIEKMLDWQTRMTEVGMLVQTRASKDNLQMEEVFLRRIQRRTSKNFSTHRQGKASP